MNGILKLSYWTFYILFPSIFFCTSCKKENDLLLADQLSIIDSAVQVTLQLNNPGAQIPEDFLGLGYEMRDITNPNYFTPGKSTLINLFNNLGPAVLRIGAVSVDKTYWTGQARNATTPIDSITTTDIDRFSNFIEKLQGWKVIFGLNLGINDAVKAADEAGYVYRKLGNRLLNFELGNEPEAYRTNKIRTPSYTYADYQNESDSYFRTIRTALPNAPFSGPGIVTATDWFTAHAKDAKAYINMLSAHFYHMAPSSNSLKAIDRLLNNENWLTKNLNVWKSIASSNGLPYRITECNSVHSGGRQGISNTFASALWAANMMWILANNNCQGVNIHVGYNSAAWYTAFTELDGQFSIRPLYYGMLFFKAGSRGKLIQLKLDDKGLKVCAYACVSTDGTIFVSLINKGLETAANVQVHTGKNISSIGIQRLTAPSITSTDQVTFAGSKVTSTGTFIPTIQEQLNATGSSFIVNVPAASALLAIIK